MTTNSCSFSIDLQYGKSLKGLVDLYGNNNKALAIANACIENLNSKALYIPTNGFIQYWHKVVSSSSKPDFNESDPTTLAKAMDDYYNTLDRSIEHTTFKSKINPNVAAYGYQSEQIRKEGLDWCASIMLDVASGYENDLQRRARIVAAMKRNPNLNPNSWSFYCKQVASRIRDEIVNRIADRQNKTVKQVTAELKAKDKDENVNIFQYIREQLGNVSVQDSNMLALMLESRTNPDFFEELKNNSNLGAIRDAMRYSDEEKLQQEAEDDSLFDDNVDSENAVTQTGDSTDDYMKTIANKGETATTWTKLIPDNIKNYFKSLRQLKSIGKDGKDYNTDNAYGVPYAMNASTCIAVLLSRCNFYNADTMINDVKKIAQQLPGFEAFIKFAKDLESNANFKMSVYHYCARALTARTEVQLTDKGFKVKKSNETVDRRVRFLYDIQNDIRNSVLNLDFTTLQQAYNDLLQEHKNAVGIINVGDDDLTLKAKNDLVAAIAKFIGYVSPEITANAINAYCEYRESNNTSGNKFLNNALVLIQNLENLAKAVKEAQNNNRTIITNIKEAKDYNDGLDKDASLHDEFEYKDIDALYKMDFMPESLTSISQFLANQLLDYSVVSVDLNGRNSEGKNVSNLIDINLMSNLIKTLSNDTALTNFGKARLQSMQYKFSNIMIEQRDKNNKVITKGLFRKKGNDYVPTEYAKDLLEINLFDGVTDVNSDKALLYKGMSKGDFVTTAFNMFVNEVDKAQYFMRIPSDAPKIFTVTAPKISTSGLILIENWSEVEKYITKTIDNIPVVKQTGSLDYAVRVNNATTFANHILGNVDRIKVTAKPGENRVITYNYSTKYSNVYYQLKGNVDNNGVMLNPELVGIIDTGDTNNELSGQATDALRKAINKDVEQHGFVAENGKRKFIKKTINTNHPIFQAFRNAAKQELHEMGIALNAMFITDENGLPIRYPKGHEKAEQLQWRDGWQTKKDRQHIGYKNYHYNGKSKDVVDVVDGKEVLTGNVFKSNKFTIFDMDSDLADEDGVVNHFQDAIAPMIDFLHRDKNTIKFVKEGGKVTDVVLNDPQKQIIDDAISTFIINYIGNFTKRFAENKDFIDNTHYTEDNIIDFALNTRLAYYMFDDLFEGNSKFYGNGQTLLKRAKETQMGGTPYGNVNYLIDFTTKEKQKVESILDEEDVKAGLVRKQIVDGKVVSSPVGIELYDRFSAVTITGTTRHNEELLKSLVKELVDNGTDPDVADSIIYGPVERNKDGSVKVDEDGKAVRTSGFQETKVNDAQSYITFEEWVRRTTARGQYPQYRELIEAILDETKPLNAQAIGQYVQVQKNVYFDIHYDNNTGINAPRQIKNAEFVLVPRFIKGTELEQLYNAMVRNGIDQVNTSETSKAGKHQEITFWDKKGNLTQENIDEFDNVVKLGNVKEDYFYNYLYTQLETPHHLNSQNKAGIQIMKKILDNIDMLPDGHPLRIAKKAIIDNFCENIKESFDDLMKECGVKTNEDGSIKFTDSGEIEGLDYKLFFDKLKDELLRLGLDSNSIDYITQIDETANNGVTRMPIYMGNFGKKLQNIANAVFNQAVTRQKLPGFHAVQVTQLGWNKYEREKSTVGTSSKLRYHPNGERYIEVALPAANFGLNKNDERWVNKKQEYIKDGKSEEEADALVKQDMLKELSDAGLDMFIGYRIPTEGKQSICVMKVVDFIDDGCGSTIVVPDEWVAQTGSDFDVDSIYGIQYTSTDGKDNKLKRYKYIPDDDLREAYKKAVLNKVTDEEKNILKINSTRTQEDVKDGLSKKDTEDDFNEALEEYGVKYGLGTLEEFKNSRREYEKKHSRDIRNNIILDNMIKILQSDEMLEENLGRSNFEDITAAINLVGSKRFKKERAARSPYDFLDQAAYQDDAMSGAKLKAFSVTRDTFCSICNTVRPKVMLPISIKYPRSMFTEHQLDSLKKRFDDIEVTDNYVIVKHDTFGWSNDNKNVVGRILTSYSSQTTAHILDAIKEGAVPNVNDFTFAVYKTFVDIGSDYETAIAFMMQPVITELVSNYNKNKSIYANNFMSAIEKTKRDICKRLGKDDADYCSVKELNDFIGSQLKVTDEVSIDKEQIINTLSKGELSDKYNLDILLQFEKLYNASQDIQDIARTLNPDKFGAKQTIYATRKVFDDIERLLGKGDVKGHILVTNDERSVIEAIYPNIRDGIQDFVSKESNESKYNTLYTFLKYATAPSIVINSQLFDTQHNAFVEQVKRIRQYLSDKNGLSEATYDEVEAYILNTIYQQAKLIRNKVDVNDKGQLDVFIDDSDEGWLEESRRIYGYNKGTSFTVFDKDGNKVEFSIKDLDKPTTDELKMFAQLSPAQKVAWMKANYEHAGLFDIIKARLKDPNLIDKEGVNTQRINFNDSSNDIEFVINEFNKAFHNSDVLSVMTALDIIKYAFVVEGYRMRQNGVTRLIKNDALYDSFSFNIADENLGTGIVDDVRFGIKNFAPTYSFNPNIALYERFLRGHQDITEIPKATVKKKGKGYELVSGALHIINIPRDSNAMETLIKYNIVEESNTNSEFSYKGKAYKFNSYVKLSFGSKEGTLYRVESRSSGIYLIPLNKLMPNETTDISAKAEFNKEQPVSVLLKTIELLEQEGKPFNGSEVSRLLREGKITLTNYKANTNKADTSDELDIDNPPKGYVGAAEILRDKVSKTFATRSTGELYIQNKLLDDFIKDEGIANTKTKVITVTMPNGTQVKRKFDIYKVPKNTVKSYNKTYLSVEGKSRTLGTLPDTLKDIITINRNDSEYGKAASPIYHLFVITPHIDVTTNVEENDEVFSLFEDIEDEIDMAYKSEDREARNRYADEGIYTSTNINNINKHSALRITSENIENRVNSLLSKIYNFEEIGTLDSNETLNAIMKDEVLRNKFLATILEVRDFVNKHKHWIDDVSTVGEDTQSTYFINKIKKAVGELTGLSILNDAKTKFIDEYVKSQSTDPRVQAGFISVLNGMYETSISSSLFHDIQETNNTFLQTVLKMVQKNVAAKDAMSPEYVKAYKNEINRLKKAAKDAGVNFDWTHIVNNKGEFTKDYNDKFINDLRQYLDAINNAIKSSPAGKYSVEAIKAKLAYDKWKLDNIEQRLVRDFYEKKLAIEERVFNIAPKEFAKFKALKDERSNIYDAVNPETGELSAEQQKRIDKIRKDLINMTADSIYNFNDGTFVPKLGSDLEKARALKAYQSDIKDLYSEYYRNSAKYGFDELLKINQAIITRKENPDSNGRPQTDMTTLLNDEEYLNARKWIAEHAHVVPDAKVQEELNEAYKILKAGKTLENSVAKFATAADAYDENGTINGSKLNDTQREAIKNQMEADYNVTVDTSDKHIINNAGASTDVYLSSFYEGISAGGKKSISYKNAITAINKITKKHYNPTTRTVNTFEMGLKELQDLKQLIDALSTIRRNTIGSTTKASREKAKKFRETYATTVYNIDEFRRQQQFASDNKGVNGDEWYKAWEELNGTEEEPNDVLYGKLVPKPEYMQKEKVDGKWVRKGDVCFVDVDKLNALETIHKYTYVTPTQYWWNAKEEWVAKKNDAYAISKEEGDKVQAEYDEWYEKNTVYNPYTHTREPIRCWTTLAYTPSANVGYEALWKETSSVPKQTSLNPNYREGVPVADNYKRGNSLYDNTDINEYEVQARDYIQGICRQLVRNKANIARLNQGFAPARRKANKADIKWFGKELGKATGLTLQYSRNSEWTDVLDYGDYESPSLNMLEELKDKQLNNIGELPRRRSDESEEDFNARLAEYNEKLEENNKKVHAALLDNNWESVFADFITEAIHYNAIQDEKEMLFFTRDTLQDLKVHSRQYNFYGKFKGKPDARKKGAKYNDVNDKRIVDQLETFMHRFLYEEWHMPEGRATKISGLLQSFTSSKYMMLNLRGGVANITLGESQIIEEALAGQFFKGSHFITAKRKLISAIPGIINKMYSDDSTNVIDAIIKLFNVVDFDEVTLAAKQLSADEVSRRLRNLMFFQQSGGEYIMQNTALIAMMLSHRIITITDADGNKTYKLMSEQQYRRYKQGNILREFLNDDQKKEYDEYIKEISKTDESKREFVYLKDDVNSKFARRLSKADRKAYVKKVEEINNRISKEFESDANPVFFDQFDLKDGHLAFKDGSLLQEINVLDTSDFGHIKVSDAYSLIGGFKRKVISVNKKIHGIYDKLGAAQIETRWYGPLVMQYHKHLYMGIQKRWKRRGSYNEEREEFEKGSYQSLGDFLSIPWRDYKDSMTDQQIEVMSAIQTVFKAYVSFAGNLSLNYKLLSDVDKANLRRVAVDFYTTTGALMLMIGIRVAMDDDDSKALNFCLYEADRLASEAWMYTPTGLVSEFKTLYSSPIASQSFVSDVYNTLNEISKMIIEGDEYNGYYKHGRYAGRSKVEVFVLRNIPIWRQYESLRDIDKSNSYYKIGQRGAGLIDTKAIAEDIKH